MSSSNTPENPNRPIVLCPLEFERSLLARTGIADRFELICCGPGAAGIQQWAGRVGSAGRPVLLAGLAGALNPDIPEGHAFVIDEVADAEGRRWKPALTLANSAGRTVATSRDRIATTSTQKSLLYEESGADLIDLESCAFAHCAETRQWRWGIVRGVSDDAATSLPPGIDEWIDARGRRRSARIVRDVLRSPSSLATMLQLRAASSRALQSAAQLLQSLEC